MSTIVIPLPRLTYLPNTSTATTWHVAHFPFGDPSMAPPPPFHVKSRMERGQVTFVSAETLSDRLSIFGPTNDPSVLCPGDFFRSESAMRTLSPFFSLDFFPRAKGVESGPMKTH